LVIAYIIAVIFFWNPKTTTVLRNLSIPVWTVILLQITSASGPFRVPLFISLMAVMLVGFVTEVNERKKRHELKMGGGN
jgi:hypothetical protein